MNKVNIDPNPTNFFPIVQEPSSKKTITEVEEALNLAVDTAEKLEEGINKYDVLRVVLKLLMELMRKVRRYRRTRTQR